MTSKTLSYQARRHPFITGLAALILGPYVLAFILLLGAICAAAVLVDWFGGRK